MSLFQRVERHRKGGDTAVATIGKPTEQAPRKPAQRSREDLLADIRDLIQDEVEHSFEELLDAPDAQDAKPRIRGMVDRIIPEHECADPREERQNLVEEVVHEISGFGPIEPYLADPTITEVMVNGPRQIYIERKGKISKVDVHFLN